MASLYGAVVAAVFSGTSGDPAFLVNVLRIWAALEVLGILMGPAPEEPGQSFSAARLTRRDRGQSA